MLLCVEPQIRNGRKAPFPYKEAKRKGEILNNFLKNRESHLKTDEPCTSSGQDSRLDYHKDDFQTPMVGIKNHSWLTSFNLTHFLP